MNKGIETGASIAYFRNGRLREVFGRRGNARNKTRKVKQAQLVGCLECFGVRIRFIL